MDASQLPIGKTVIVMTAGDVRLEATRLDEHDIDLLYYDQATNDVVMEQRVQVGGASRMVYIDPVYWAIEIDGRRATKDDANDLQRKSTADMKVDCLQRVVSVRNTKP